MNKDTQKRSPLSSFNGADCPYCHEWVLYKKLKRAKGEFFKSFVPKRLCPNCENPVKLSISNSPWVAIGTIASTALVLLAQNTSITIPIFILPPVLLILVGGVLYSASKCTLEKDVTP
jgi:hypothetical protein